MLKSEQYKKAFHAIGDITCDIEDFFQTLETYVCHLYGSGVTKTIKKQAVNDIRLTLFNRQHQMHDIDEPFLIKN